MNKFIKWVIAVAGFGLGVAAAEPVKVAVGYPPAADWLPALVAKDTGIFDKHGLDVSLSKIAIVSNIPAAIMSGSLNIGATTPTVLIDTSTRSEEHTSELQSRENLVCRLLLEKKKQ